MEPEFKMKFKGEKAARGFEFLHNIMIFKGIF